MTSEVGRRRLSPELIGRAIALAMVAAAIFVPPPIKFWVAAAGCALAAAVFLIQAALGRPVRRARWLNAVFGVIFAVTAIWLAFLRG
jgi:threonine/homoserine/homoserine lactone efflux protein